MDAIERHLPEVVPEFAAASDPAIVVDLRDDVNISVEGSGTVE